MASHLEWLEVRKHRVFVELFYFHLNPFLHVRQILHSLSIGIFLPWKKRETASHWHLTDFDETMNTSEREASCPGKGP